MRTWRRKRTGGLALLVGFLAIHSACLDEDLFVDEGLPAWGEAAGFLGFDDADQKRTVCAACHPEVQSLWEATHHARAWEGLQGSGQAAASCEPCHTTSALGSAVTESNVAFVRTSDPRYVQVQCESCHGPGQAHVADPALFRPLASIKADPNAASGCGECHRGVHHPFVAQWAQSGHGSSNASTAARVQECAPCHEGRAALSARFGVDSDYLERGASDPLPLVCSVCHDPHDSNHGGQLRASITESSTDNLCVTCHARRGRPPSPQGPHAAQGLLLLVERVGWIPPGSSLDPERLRSTHGTDPYAEEFGLPSTNSRLCVTCHMPTSTVTDAATGQLVFESVGHLFRAAACLDSNGISRPGTCGAEERDFRACASSECHTSQEQARSLFTLFRRLLERRLDEIWFDSNGNHVIDPSTTDGGLLPRVVAQGNPFELDLRDEVVTVAEGALWNAQLAHTSTRPWFGDGRVFGQSFSATRASGGGTHNPWLLHALLVESIEALIKEYDL